MNHDSLEASAVPLDPGLSGAVLAGGRSRRMGHPKERIRVHGETLLDRQLRILREAGAGPRWISTGRGAGAGPSGPPVPDDVRWIEDAEPGLGPLAGLSALLDAVRTPWILVLAVDLPAMTPDFLRRLASRRLGGTGAVPCLSGRYEPLVALYPQTLAATLRERLRARKLRLQTLVEEAIASGHLVGVDVPREERALFANWNRPEDLTPDAGLTG